MLRLIEQAGIERPRCQAQIGRYTADFLWPAARVIVETDGWNGHRHELAFHRDRRRDAWLLAHGYVVIRFTWPQLRDEPLTVVAQVAAVLAHRGELGAPPTASSPTPRLGGSSPNRHGNAYPLGKGGVVPVVPTAVLFPGQGSQTPDMRDLVAQREPELLDRCLDLVGEDPFARVEESTRFQQPAIFCASIAGWRALDLEPQFAAGHSLGELAALAAAGVLDRRGRARARRAPRQADGRGRPRRAR